MRYAGIAALASFLFTVGVHIYDCQTGNHEQCLMSQGLSWLYWLVSFLVAWAVVASFGALIRHLREMIGQDDA